QLSQPLQLGVDGGPVFHGCIFGRAPSRWCQFAAGGAGAGSDGLTGTMPVSCRQVNQRRRSIAGSIPAQESAMRIGDVMSRDVCVVSPATTLREAAREMARRDVGCLPVGEDDRLVGIVTDRDIVLRRIGEGLDPDSSVREVMTAGVKYCFDDEDVDEVAANMAGLEKRRLPVLNRDMRLVGIVSLANFAYSHDQQASQELLRGVARPH